MAAYISLLAFVLMVFAPLWVPVGITLTPFVSSGVRRVRRAIA